MLAFELHSPLRLGIVSPVSPENGDQLLWFEAHLCSMQLCELDGLETPPIVSTGKSNIATLGFEVVFNVFILWRLTYPAKDFFLSACKALIRQDTSLSKDIG